MAGRQPLPTCASCELRRFCFPVESGWTDSDVLQDFIASCHRVAKGQALYRAGDPAASIYAVRSGYFKTLTRTEQGERISGFQMAGDMLGLDGVGHAVHALDAVALEDSQVCVVPRERLEAATLSARELQREFHRILGDEIVRDHRRLGLVPGANAEQRLAAFLVDMGERHGRLGHSSTSLVLRMSRSEIGAHLGLQLETVSRAFSRLQAMGILSVHHREIEVLQPAALKALAQGLPPG